MSKEVEQPKEMGKLEAILSAAKEAGGQMWDAAKPMFDHGRTELAATLFRRLFKITPQREATH